MTLTRRATLTVVPKHDDTAWQDRELVAALLEGDRTAAIVAYRRFAPRVFGIVQRTMGPGADAEDLTQDIFLRVFARIHTLREPDALSSFVLSVALRVLRWKLRQMRVRRILRLSDDGDLPEYAESGPDAEAREALRRFYGHLQQLPVDERTAFSLRHLEGMDLREIAEVVGTSLATVKRRIGRARNRLVGKIQVDAALKSYLRGKASHES